MKLIVCKVSFAFMFLLTTKFVKNSHIKAITCSITFVVGTFSGIYLHSSIFSIIHSRSDKGMVLYQIFDID